MNEIHLDRSLLQVPDSISGPPLLIIHGGGWRYGEPEHMQGVARVGLGLGRPCFSVGYRKVSKHHTFDDALADCLAALDFLCGGCDGALPAHDRVVVVGASAGGHLAQCTACAVPGRVSRLVSLAGPTDLARHWFVEHDLDLSSELVQQFFGGEPGLAQLAAASPQPVTGMPPLLICHSIGDRLVHYAQADVLAAKWQDSGASVERCHLDGGAEKDHALFTDGDLVGRELRDGYAAALRSFLS